MERDGEGESEWCLMQNWGVCLLRSLPLSRRVFDASAVMIVYGNWYLDFVRV